MKAYYKFELSINCNTVNLFMYFCLTITNVLNNSQTVAASFARLQV